MRRGTIVWVIWVWVVVLVAVIGAVAVVVAGRDSAMGEVYDDRPDATLPTGRPLTAADLEALRFSTAVRGYRMDEVDALLSRMQADLRAQERTQSAAADHAVPADPDGPFSERTEGSPSSALKHETSGQPSSSGTSGGGATAAPPSSA